METAKLTPFIYFTSRIPTILMEFKTIVTQDFFGIAIMAKQGSK